MVPDYGHCRNHSILNCGSENVYGPNRAANVCIGRRGLRTANPDHNRLGNRSVTREKRIINRIKLKSRPEDFVVEEKINLDPKESGAYAIYKVEKRGLATDQLVGRLGRWMSRPVRDFSFAGMKDRHGITVQYLSLKGAGPRQVSTDSVSAIRIGYLDHALNRACLEGNSFEIVVRNLDQSAVDKIRQSLRPASIQGIPNYFDDQRFRSQRSARNAFGFLLLRQDFSGALKIYICECLTKSKAISVEAAESFIREWGNWKSLGASFADRAVLKRPLKYLQSNPNDFHGAILRLNRVDARMMISAAYSFLWNECLKQHIKYRESSGYKSIRGAWQDYYFFSQLDDPDLDYLSKLQISVPEPVNSNSDHDNDYLSQICSSFGLDSERLSSSLIEKFHPGGIHRNALMYPESIAASEAGVDELNSGRLKLKLSFFLKPGSYATMVLKRLTL